MPLYTAPGVYFETLDENAGQVRRLRTDVAGFTGICERGPLDVPVRVTSWEQFRTCRRWSRRERPSDSPPARW